jgi:hypothetical protein
MEKAIEVFEANGPGADDTTTESFWHSKRAMRPSGSADGASSKGFAIRGQC